MSDTPIRLLLVEDDPDQALLVKRALARQEPPFAVTVVGDGFACLQAIAKETPAVLVLDYSLPRMSGLDVLRHVKAQGIAVPVVMVTGQGDERVAVEAMKAGAMDYVVKSTSYLGSLPAVLHKVLKQHALATENARLEEEAARRLRETEGLLAVAHALSGSLDRHEIGSRTARAVTQLLGADASVFFSVDETADACRPVAGFGLPADLADLGAWPLVAGVARGIEADEAAFTPHAGAAGARDGLLADRVVGACPIRPRAFLYAPVGADSRLLGSIVSYWWKDAHAFTDDDVRLAAGYASQVALALENARLYEKAQRTLTELETAQDQLVRGATLRALGEMASGAAHHLNNLLMIILGRVNLLRLDPQARAFDKALEAVERASEDAAEVVRRVQRFAHTQHLEDREPVDLNDVAREVLEMTRPLWQDAAQARGVRVDAELRVGLVPPVVANAPALREVGTNLVLNAVDALPRGGRIALRTFTDGPWACLAVIDDGVGMSEETRQRALQPFFTTKGPRSTGLGLSVNYGIVKDHDGELVIESTEGKGTTVVVRLPMHGARRPGAVAGPAQPAAAARPRGGVRVLVVDDDDEVREVVSTMLTRDGQSVLQARGGHEALRLLEAHPVDLVITDLGMPDMTGWEVARRIAQERPALPVVLMTGWGDEIAEEAAEQRTVMRVLAKPIRLRSLQEVLAASRAAHETSA